MSQASPGGNGFAQQESAGGGGWAIGSLETRANTEGLWDLNGDLLDSSKNGLTLSETGTAPSLVWQKGFGRTWRYFDGNYGLEAGAPFALSITGDLTIQGTLWMQETTLTGNWRLFGHLPGGGAAADNSNYLIYREGAVNRFNAYHQNGLGYVNQVPFPQSDPNSRSGAPFHLTVRRTISTKTYDFFINGMHQYGSTYASDPTDGEDAEFSIGADFGGANGYAGIGIANVRVDREALTDADILEDAEAVMDGRL